jgi:hypothetical protein
MQVRIPENASPGSTMNISLADGRRIGIQVPQGALPGTVIQFQVPLSQSQPTSQQRYTQQPTSQPQKHDEHQYNEEINRRRRQEEQKNINQRRNAGQQRNENPKEDQFEMIGLSKRNSVHPENNHHNLNGRSNYKSSSVVPYNGSGSGGGGGGVNNNLHLERRSNNSSSLGDGHISFCCCFNQQILTNMSNISFCLTLACCSATGFLRLLPWYSEQLYTIQESHVGIIEDLGGKFVRVEKSGIILLSAPCAVPLESIKETLSTRIQQLVVKLETKTKDNGTHINL